MTRLPGDPIDPYEARLAAIVRDHSDAAIVPIDATAIAHAVAVSHPRRRFGRLSGAPATFGRLGWIAAAGLIAIAALGGFSLGGGGRVAVISTPPETPTTAPTTAPTPAATQAPTEACTPADLSARVVRWTGAAGQRIADLTITNTSAVACDFPSVTKPQLVDGTGSVLIDGTQAAGGSELLLAAGAGLTTMAEDGNYCGPTPVAPVTVAIILGDGSRVTAAPVSPTDTIGLAPCMGSGEPASITIHTWN